MRTKALLFSDMRFQIRYGFYATYAVLTLVYIGLLFALPAAWRGDAALLMIYTDPAAMGLFFMGSIVLFEKNERVLDSLAISPVAPAEYVLSKLCSIGVIATLTAVLIGAAAGAIRNPVLFVLAVFVCSCLFSALGLIVACRIKTLNQFLFATVPLEIAATVPAVLWMFWFPSDVWLLHPGAAMLSLCGGRGSAALAVLSLLVWTLLAVRAAVKTADKMLKSVGGITI